MSIFCFKQFSVSHDFGMKVGTDAVLLGIWTPIDSTARVLDIGTGTGIIALILAQRGVSEILGIDLDAESVTEAKYNVVQSPWNNKINILHGDFREEHCINQLGFFDVIVSNPPFFIDSMKSPFGNRNIARHTTSLPFETLIINAKRILKPDGKLCVILPDNESNIFTQLAKNQNLYPEKICEILPYPNASVNRKMIAFQQKQLSPQIETLCIRNAERSYSYEYKLFTKDFYLNLEKKQERR